MNRFDVVIAGGGLVGAALACGLARQGRKVAVIEAAARDAGKQPSYDDRTLVINAASLNILANLGLLPSGLNRTPIEHIEISRAGGFGHVSLHASDHDCQRFGAVIVARELGQAMLAAMQRQTNITELCPATLADYSVDDHAVEIRLADGRCLTADLLVGADGNHSRVRQQARLACDVHEYGQSAMIFNVMASQAPIHTAWERFTPVGPLALLPQPGGRLGVVWVDTHDGIDQAMGQADETLLKRLNQHFGASLGQFTQVGQRARYPLMRQRTAWPVAERVVVVGNAANAVHPVSAQGFNLGLRDVAGLIDQLTGVEDPGQAQSLAAYAQARQHDQESTVRYTDTLARAFTNPSALASLFTGLGLAAHAGLPALSRRLVRSAMGFREPVSSLARDPGEPGHVHDKIAS
jgi:2-octaprenyl-6-methoxyphenol hydroxylase